MTTPTENTWTPISYRLPQASDCDETHGIELLSIGGFRKMLYEPINAPWIVGYTHYRRVELPPLPQREQTQEEKDRRAFIEWHNKLGGDSCEASRSIGWLNALALERSHLGGISAEQFFKELREILHTSIPFAHAKGGESFFEVPYCVMDRLFALLDRCAKG